MNDILFYLLILALLYYFFYYLPHQKQTQTTPPLTPLTHSQFTQTDPHPITKDDPQLESTLDQLIKQVQQLNKSLK